VPKALLPSSYKVVPRDLPNSVLPQLDPVAVVAGVEVVHTIRLTAALVSVELNVRYSDGAVPDHVRIDAGNESQRVWVESTRPARIPLLLPLGAVSVEAVVHDTARGRVDLLLKRTAAVQSYDVVLEREEPKLRSLK
jgi:hypothetical protein